MLKIIFSFLGLLFITLECKSQRNSNDLLGNVYSFEGECKKWTNTYINGFRIEETTKDSLYVNFSFNKGLFWKLSMIYNKDSNTFNSRTTIPFYTKESHYRSNLNMSIKENYILLSYKNKENKFSQKKYLLTHKDSIINRHIRNAYYAEEGFKLCKE